MSQNRGEYSGRDQFQSPPQKAQHQPKIGGNQSTASPMKNLLSIISPGSKNHSTFKSNLLQTLFPSGASQGQHSPYRTSPYSSRSRSKIQCLNNLLGNQFRSEQEFKESTHRALEEQGYNEENIKAIQSNMLVIKSIEAVKEERQYLKDKMRSARDNSKIKAKVKTVNKNYKKPNSSVRSTRAGLTSSMFKETKKEQPKKATTLLSAALSKKKSVPSAPKVKPDLTKSNTRSQRIIELEQILLQCSQPFNYSKRPQFQSVLQQPSGNLTMPADQPYQDDTKTQERKQSDNSLERADDTLTNGLASGIQYQNFMSPTKKESDPVIEYQNQDDIITIENQELPSNAVSPQKMTDEAMTMEELQRSPPKPIQSEHERPQEETKKAELPPKKTSAPTKFTPAPEPQPNKYVPQPVQPTPQAQPKQEEMAKSEKLTNKRYSSQKAKKTAKTPMKKKSSKNSQKMMNAESMRSPMIGNVKDKTLTAKKLTQDSQQQYGQEEFADGATSEGYTHMQSPMATTDNKFQATLGQSQYSMFQSPDAKFTSTYKGPNLIQDVTVEAPTLEEESPGIEEKRVRIEKKNFDSEMNFLDQIAQYRRKKDESVAQLIEEFKNSKTLDSNKPEHKGKWIQRGESPTKRLIQLKEAAHIHHPDVVHLNNFSVENQYSIKYVASPKKSYLVNPKEGEIDYSDAKKNFNKFFNRVSQQPIVKHRIVQNKKKRNHSQKWFKHPNDVKSKETTRPRMRGPSTNRMSMVAIADKN